MVPMVRIPANDQEEGIMTEAAEVKSLILELAAKAVLCDHLADGACLECIVNFGQAVALATYEDAKYSVENCIRIAPEGEANILKRALIAAECAIQRRAEEIRNVK